MKHILSFLIIFSIMAGMSHVTAQACDGERYYSFIFPSYDSSTVVYSNDNMTMDIYQPHDDTATARRTILMIHGGNFYQGSSVDPFIYFICQQYVQRGYVMVSINYSLLTPTQDLNGVILNDTTAYPVIAQTISEGHAAVRYLKMNAAALHIDTSWIVIGGEETGALIANQIAYMKSYVSDNPLLDSAIADLGGIDGNSGNPGYSSKVKAVLNFSGGVLDVNIFSNLDNEPLYSSQGDSDHVIPFVCGSPFDGYANYQMCGAGSMQPLLSSLGIPNQLEFYDSLDHQPWGDTIYSGPLQGHYIQSMVDSQAALFLYQIACPSFTTAIREVAIPQIGLYPNPSSGTIFIKADAAIRRIDIIDYTGRIITTSGSADGLLQMDISNFSSGIYLAKIDLGARGIATKTFIKE